MSHTVFEFMRNVRSRSPLKGSARSVHMALAEHVNDAGECWPSQETLAREANCSVRTVKRAINTLVSMGYLEVWQAPNDHRQNRYKLTMIGDTDVPQIGDTDVPHRRVYKEGTPKEVPKRRTTSVGPARPDQEEEPMNRWTPDDDYIPPVGGPYETPANGGEVPIFRGKEIKRARSVRLRSPEELGFRHLLVVWREKSAQVTSREVNIGHLRKITTKLRLKYSWEEIEVLVGMFFTKEAQNIRAKTDIELSAMFQQALYRGLEQQAASRMRSVGSNDPVSRKLKQYEGARKETPQETYERIARSKQASYRKAASE